MGGLCQRPRRPTRRFRTSESGTGRAAANLRIMAPSPCRAIRPQASAMTRIFRRLLAALAVAAASHRRARAAAGPCRLRHRLARAGRARRLLPGARRRHLRKARARRDDQDGRPAGQRPAAPRRRPARRRDGRRAAGALRRRAERADHRDRRDVPEESDGDHRAPGRGEARGPQGRSRSPWRGGNTTFWPWLKQRYGFTDDQKRPYAFSVQPFLVDPKLSQQGFATSEPFSIEKGGVKPVVFLLAEQGYPPYSEVLAVRRDALARRGDALTRFVRASAEGWKSYLANPAPGNALIKRDNPQMGDELLAYGHRKMKEYAIVTGRRRRDGRPADDDRRALAADASTSCARRASRRRTSTTAGVDAVDRAGREGAALTVRAPAPGGRRAGRRDRRRREGLSERHARARARRPRHPTAASS